MSNRRWHFARVLAVLLATLGLTLILVAVALAAESVDFQGYRVIYKSATFDGTNTEFTYRVCSFDNEILKASGLSHWTLELCTDGTDSPFARYVADSCSGYGLPAGSETDFGDSRANITSYGTVADPCGTVAEGTSSLLTGIKWADPVGTDCPEDDCTLGSEELEDACDEFKFKLSGDWSQTTDLDDVSFLLKLGGPGELVSTDILLTGPGCEGTPTAVTLSSFGAGLAETGPESWPYIGLAGTALLAVGTVMWSRGRRR